MSINNHLLARLGFLLVCAGVGVGVFGSVKPGAILLAVGTILVSLGRSSSGKVERYMPIALALALLAMAFALP